jgi:hypothetical protein
MGNLNDLSANAEINVALNVDFRTARTCLAIVEMYLNQHDTECLVIENNEPGAWDLRIKDWREIEDE